MNETEILAVYRALDAGDYEMARQMVYKALKELDQQNKEEKFGEEIKLYGLLLDVGSEGHNEDDLNMAVEFYKSNAEKLSSGENRCSYFYNLANGVDSLARMFYSRNRGIHSLEVQKSKFQEAIQYYWTALKSNINDESLFQQIHINLSNSLTIVGRFVEAIQFLDAVVTERHAFPQALVSRADHLDRLAAISSCSLSVAFYSRIYLDYDNAIKTNQLPPYVLNRVTERKDYYSRLIEENGFSAVTIDAELEVTREEFATHSELRKYSIRNHLTLNEHALYCPCCEAEKDNIQIGVPHGQFTTEILPKLELLLNRLKSEFSFARWSYFKSLSNNEELNFDVQFSDLLEFENLSPAMEMRRSSFRICYGILDKIALGICKMFGVPATRIHFETFWENSKVKLILNNTRNLHLNALYSIACDLNTASGELRHFKNWRNKLEHNLLIVKDTLTYDRDYLRVFEDKDFVTVVDETEFTEKALHLLQLTRAAIFSFVYCVRLQTIEHPNEEIDDGIEMNLR